MSHWHNPARSESLYCSGVPAIIQGAARDTLPRSSGDARDLFDRCGMGTACTKNDQIDSNGAHMSDVVKVR